MKAETFLSAYGISCVRKGMEISKHGVTGKFMRLVRQSSAYRARLLAMYSGDFLRFIENSRNEWRERAYLADQEIRELRQQLEELENAWAVDETIQPDGSLRPSLADTVKRAAELEAENRQLCELRVQELREELEQTKRFTDALRPFAKLAEQADATIYRWQDDQQIGTFSPFGADWPTLGDCRRAREALLPKKDGDA